MTLKVSIELDGMTFGDLYNFVDLARGAHIGGDEVVTQVPYENHEDNVIHKFEVELPDGNLRKAPDMSGLDRTHLIAVLDNVIEEDGDARGALPELKELRDSLI
ncbi:hypothetical protein [Rhodococcus qingshengii]|jgi:hypothetical protein|uniref:hypothetical protein n=1 Tax=Rhodococcus qingshengii TaxID=334542 RepID=UPI0006D11965|nr:hypothetical protein [Rhodococcus qingshengii]ORC19998.1 hypothetical protein BXO91_23180 [Rhodococcus qingshengii]